jgi:hypothetical protein
VRSNPAKVRTFGVRRPKLSDNTLWQSRKGSSLTDALWRLLTVEEGRRRPS